MSQGLSATMNVLVPIYLLLMALPFQASAQTRCGPDFNDNVCPSNLCCNSLSGWCGDLPGHCDPPDCDPKYGKCGSASVGSGSDDEGKCGPGYGNCTGSMCCSESNYCGSDEEYCSLTLGCQPDYGYCGLSSGGLSNGEIGGIAAAAVAFVSIVMIAIWFYFKRNSAKRYTYNQLSAATGGFHQDNKLGDGTYGEVYKGTLDGKTVAVKKLKRLNLGSKTSTQKQIKSFEAEIKTRTEHLNHINLMEVIGFCVKNEDRFIVYEYMPNGSLKDWLFAPDPSELQHADGVHFLEWSHRFNIAKGVAEGLVYLHHSLGRNIKSIVHGDIKPDNILLGQGLVPKLADFGMMKLIKTSTSDQEDEEAPNTPDLPASGLQGTEGYVDPKPSPDSNLHHKADVYSFGVVLLEIVSGRRVYGRSEDDSQYYLPLQVVDFFIKKHEDPSIVVDSRLDLRPNERDEVMRVLRIGLWCIQYEPQDRPNMNVVLDLLKGNTIDESKYQNPPPDANLSRMNIQLEYQRRDLFRDQKVEYRFKRSSTTSDGSQHPSSRTQPSNLSNSTTDLRPNGNNDDEIQIAESPSSPASASILSHSQPLSDLSEFSPVGQQKKGVNHPD